MPKRARHPAKYNKNIEFGSFTKGFSARFWAIVGATFLGFLGIGTVSPGLGPHIRHDLGGSDQTVGFVIGVFSFVALASRFFSGPLADHRGRKIAFLAGLFSCALAGGAYLLPFGIAGASISAEFCKALARLVFTQARRHGRWKSAQVSYQ